MRIFFFIFLLLSPSVFACMGPPLETRTFFKKLPKKLENKEYIAKVKILETKAERERVTKVKVLSVIKGKSKSNQFSIKSDGPHSCNRDLWIKVGDIVIIAGKFDRDGWFKGTWKGISQFSK